MTPWDSLKEKVSEELPFNQSLVTKFLVTNKPIPAEPKESIHTTVATLRMKGSITDYQMLVLPYFKKVTNNSSSLFCGFSMSEFEQSMTLRASVP